MAVGIRYSEPNVYEIDQNGVPLIGGQLFFFVTGTSTPLSTYADVNLTIPNPNPIVLDSNGRAGSVFLTQAQAYKVQLFTANPNPAVVSTPSDPQGTEIWTEDPVGPAAGGVQVVNGIIGEVRAFAGIASAIPAQWYECYGQAVSRTTYALAFAVLGTTWGNGDGSSTFNLPDLRGRVMAGLDNMGGTAANRITSGVCGVPGTTLGGAGGSQLAQMDTFTAVSTVTDPGHSHTSTATGAGTNDGSNFIQGGTVWDLFRNITTNSATTGITVATTVTGTLTGTSQNVQPTAMVYYIIYLAA
jgi:microcystin-dependent protein